MLPNTYLKVSLESISDQETKSAETPQIICINSAEKLKDHNLSPSLAAKIETTIEEKKNKVYVLDDGLHLMAAINTEDSESYRLFGAELANVLLNEKINSASLEGLDIFSEKQIYSLLEGILLKSYDFDKYKKDASKELITIYIKESDFSSSALLELNNLAKASSYIKTWVNEPLNKLDALDFSGLAEEMGVFCGFETEILHKEQIIELKMGGLLAVNQGSSTPPTFNIFTHNPTNAINTKPLVLVGKGVMFDTGGYSLKTGGSMPTMKADMAGGAAVLGILCAVAMNKLPYHIIGLVPATDNKISANAMVVDDVITMMDGTTVEVLNTDAEGRLVLADALTYAKRFDPELVIDMATLTGASVSITGSFGVAMAGNDQARMDELTRSGESAYERLSQLPLWPEFSDLLKSPIADLKNIGGPIGGASTAAMFLKHFTDYPWIHLDIAGAAFIKDAKGYQQMGATSTPLRMIYEFIKSRCENSEK